MKVLIVDDEKHVREMIHALLDECSEVTSVEEAESLVAAKNQIQSFSPDLVLLDIQIKDKTGLDLLEELDEIKFEVIFITSHSQYALDAFNFSALNYLLKPIDIQKFFEAIKNAAKKINDKTSKDQLSTLMKHFKGNESPKEFIIKTSDKIFLISVDDISRCKSDNNYTEFYHSKHGRIIASKTLKTYEKFLEQHNFFRTHQSHMINLKYFSFLNKEKDYQIEMQDGSQVPLSLSKRNAFLTWLNEKAF